MSVVHVLLHVLVLHVLVLHVLVQLPVLLVIQRLPFLAVEVEVAGLHLK